MADKATQLYQQLINKQNEVVESMKKLETQTKSNIETNKLLEAQLKGATGAKQLATAQKELQGNIKATALAEKEAIKIQQELEKLEQQRIRTASAQSKEKARLARETSKLNSLYKQESARLTELRNRAKDLAIQLQKDTKEFGRFSKQAKKTRTELKALTGQTNKLDRNLKKIDSSLGQSQRFVGQYGKAWGGISKILGAAGFAGGLFLAVNAVKKAGAQIRQFGKQSAILAGVLGKSRKEIALLTADAKRLGGQTAKTSNDVLLLQTAYARLGFSQQEILELTSKTINGSIALNAELEDTAELTGAVVRSFDEFSTTDAGIILDQLTLSTQKTALNFTKLQTAIPIVAGAAAAANVPFKTMIAQLGQAADRGIEASTSATSLRNIYIELSKKGLTLEQALSKINNSQDKLSTATQLFGKRAAVTALALASSTDKTNELETALDNAGGTAKKVADEQLKTLDGRLILLTSAWQGFIDSLNNNESVIAKTINGLLTGVTDLLKIATNLGAVTDIMFGDITELDGATLDLALSLFEIEKTGKTIIRTFEDLNDKFKDTGGLTLTNAAALKEWQEIALEDGKTIEEANVLYARYVFNLKETEFALKKAIEEAKKKKKATEGEVEVTTDLIEIQKELLKQANELPGATKKEILFRNAQVKAIQEEIKMLKELGIVKGLQGKGLGDSLEGLGGEFNLSDLEEAAQKKFDIHARNEERITEKLREEERKRAESREQWTQFGYDAASQITGVFFDQQQQRRNDELEAQILAGKEMLNNESLNAEQRKLIEKELLDNERKLRVENTKSEKRNALFEVGIQTALWIAKYGFFSPQAIAAGAAGLLQAGLIAAKPIPAFDKGTDKAPKGLIQVAEKNPEIAIKDGNAMLINTPIVTDQLEGAKIIGSAETSRMMDQVVRHQVIDGLNNSKNEAVQFMIADAVEKAFDKTGDKIVKAIKNNKPQPSNFDQAYLDTKLKYKS